jgi:hypothetical protein
VLPPDHPVYWLLQNLLIFSVTIPSLCYPWESKHCRTNIRSSQAWLIPLWTMFCLTPIQNERLYHNENTHFCFYTSFKLSGLSLHSQSNILGAITLTPNNAALKIK